MLMLKWFIKQYKFTLISFGIFITTCFIGNWVHILLAGILSLLILFGELFCNKTLKQFEQNCRNDVDAAKEEAEEMLKQYKAEEHKCNCNGTCGGNCKCYKKEK